MAESPKVSIVIPVWNSGAFLAQTVDSVRKQTFQDWELVIVDDGSTDDSAAVAASCARSDARIRVILHEANRGQSAARNTGFANTTQGTPYVLFLDADDILVPEAIEVLRDRLNACPSAPAVHGRVLKMDGEGRELPEPAEPGLRREVLRTGARWKVRQLRDSEPTTFGALCVLPYLTTPGQVLIRRESLLQLGPEPWRVTADFWSDTDLWLRLARDGALEAVPQVVMYWRTHPGGMSARVGSRLAGLERIRLLEHTAASDAERDLLLAGWRVSDRLWAAKRLRWSLESLRAGEPVQALKHFRHAGRTLVHSVTLKSYRSGEPVSL